MPKSPLMTIVIVLLLAFFAGRVYSQHIDLRGGAVVDRGYCKSTKLKKTPCLVVVFKEKTYNILFDQKGELEIFLIEGEKSTFIWSRGSI